MTTRIIEFKKPKLKNPIFIEGLPGIGHVARFSAGYLAEQLNAKKFAELYSSHFLHSVLLHETSVVHLLKNEFFFWKAKERNQRDLVILLGECQSIDPEGHYEVVEKILEYVRKLGVRELITIGGLRVGRIVKPRVVGAVNDPELIKKYKGFGIEFETGRRLGTIVGATGLLLGLASYYGIKGLCLLGETPGFPLIPDPRSSEAVLRVLCRILNVSIDLTKLERKVKEMERFIRKLEQAQKESIAELLKIPKKPEELRYIG
jgi:hypothetical protein